MKACLIRQILLSKVFVLMVGVGVVSCTLSNKPTPTMTPIASIPNFMGIFPQLTTAEEAIKILGEPNDTKLRKGYLIFIYSDKVEFDWKKVEIWVNTSSPENLVIGVFRYSAVSWEEHSLADLVAQFGKPDKVTWSMLRGSRFLIWAQIGISVRADAEVNIREWEELRYGQILLFHPQTIESFINYDWPWPSVTGFSKENLFANTNHAPDTLPEDPYPWGDVLEEK